MGYGGSRLTKALYGGVVVCLLLAVLGVAVILYGPKESTYHGGALHDTYGAKSTMEMTFSGSTAKAEALDTKIIYTGQMKLEVQDLDEVSQAVLDFVQREGGFVASSRMWQGTNDRRFLQFVLRIPSGSFSLSFEHFMTKGKVLDKSTQGQDITQEYYDLATRLQTKRQQENRYLEILQQAVTVDDVLRVERELERIRTEIESMEGRIRFFEDRIDLATLTLNLEEPLSQTLSRWNFRDFVTELGRTFVQSLDLLLHVLAGLLPWIVLLACGFFLVGMGRRRKKK